MMVLMASLRFFWLLRPDTLPANDNQPSARQVFHTTLAQFSRGAQ